MSLLDIFKNRKQILEGLKNKIFKQEHVEAVAKERWEQHCVRCESLDRDGKKGKAVLVDYLKKYNEANNTELLASELISDEIIIKILDFIDDTVPANI